MVWGLLLSIVATGMYDTLKALMEWDIHQETIVVAATLIVALLILYTFRKDLIGK